jgi:SpoVK/Ycf46/Vps4 family AAA+-type ATPase
LTPEYVGVEIGEPIYATQHAKIHYFGDFEAAGEQRKTDGFTQFSTVDGIKFFPANHTVPSLPPGVYDILTSQSGIFFEGIKVKTDGLISFPETNSEIVVKEIEKFWDREQYFKNYNLTFKRGLLLYGPPGSGKSSTIQLIIADIIRRKGAVLKFTHPQVFKEGIRTFRQIQPDTPLLVLMEDIEAILDQYSESEVLNILDGVDQIDKVVYLATTNYPENLGARILNRPSRFDKRFKMGHPGSASRELYLRHLITEDTIKEHDIDIKKWVKDTSGMSIAHLKELFVTVCILGNEYAEAVETLKEMQEETPSSTDDRTKRVGFAHANAVDRR